MRWRVALCLLLLLPSAYCAWVARDIANIGAFHDSALYWVSAKSLAEGSGYRIASLPGAPYQTKYPPLFPLILSLVWRIHPSFPANLPLVALLLWLSLPACLLLLRPVLSDLGLGPRHSTLVLALLALSPYMLMFATNVMTELPFCSLLFACLTLATRAGGERERPHLAALAGLLGGLGFLMRTAAIVLLASAPLWLLLRKRYRSAAVFFACMLPAVLAWLLWVRAHMVRSADLNLLFYTDYVRYHFLNFGWLDMPRVVARNFTDLLQAICAWFIPADLVSGLAMLVGLAALYSAARLAWDKGLSQYHLFAAFSLVMLLVWESGTTRRFIRLALPCMMLLLAGITTELRRLFLFVKTARRPVLRLAMAPVALGVLLLLLIAAIGNTAMMVHFPEFRAQERARLAAARPGYEWMRKNLPGDAVVLSDDDPTVWLYTGRRGFIAREHSRLAYFGGEQQLSQYLIASVANASRLGATHVLLRRDENGKHLLFRFAIPDAGMPVLYDDRRLTVFRAVPRPGGL